MKNKGSDKIHIHRVVSQRLFDRGIKRGGFFPGEYEKVKFLYGDYMDEKGMIPISVLQRAQR